MHNEPHHTDAAGPLDAPAIAAPPKRGAARLAMMLVSVLLAIGVIIGGYVVVRNLATDGLTKECPEEELTLVGGAIGKPFGGWDKPDLALVITGQMHGYIFPCGCSDPQYGGLIRRQTFIDELTAKGWDVVGIDIGEIGPTTGIPKQRELKIEYTLKALDLMGYKVYGLGKHELSMGLVDFLGIHSLNNPKPRPIASTLDGAKDFEVHSDEMLSGKAKSPPRIGVLSLTGPDLEVALNNNGDKDLKFLNNQAVVLPGIQKAFAGAKPKIDLAILLYHEYPANPPNQFQADAARLKKAEMTAQIWEKARAANKNIPPLGIIAIVTDVSEPPFGMTPVAGTPTHVMQIGHKGKYVGVVGLYKTGKKLDMKYEVVLIEQRFQPKAGKKNEVLELLQRYAKRVKDEDLLNQYIRAPHPTQVDPAIQKKYGGAYFVGSEACKDCHAKDYNIWAATKHAKAFQTLVNANAPSLRQFDPECVICHTVGFKHNGGWNELPHAELKKLAENKAGGVPAIQKALKNHNARLAQVGCESCHGPGSAHIESKKNMDNDGLVDDLINPFRPALNETKQDFNRRMLKLNDFCQKCHDEENDVQWKALLGKKVDFDNWVGERIIHNRKNNPGNQFLPKQPPAVRADNGNKE